MEQYKEQNQRGKGRAVKAIRIMGQAIIWMLVQLAVIICLTILRLSPAGLIAAIAHAHGPVASVAGALYSAVCIVAGVIYTAIGVVVCNRVEINSKKWWRVLLILYGIYMAVTLIGMMASMGAWFFEGYGFLILDVWVAPLLWLAELELWWHLKVRRHGRIQKEAFPGLRGGDPL